MIGGREGRRIGREGGMGMIGREDREGGGEG